MTEVSSIFVYVLGRILPALIAFTSLIIYSHLVPPETYARFSFSLAIAYVVNTGLHQWIRTTLTRFYIPSDSTTRRNLNSCVAFNLSTNFILVIILSPFLFFNSLLEADIGFIILIVITMSVSDLLMEVLRVEGRALTYGLSYVLRQTCALILGIVGFIATNDYRSLYVGIVVGLCASALLALLFVRRQIRIGDVSWKNSEQFLRFGAPLAATYISSAALNNIDTLLVIALVPANKAGQYALCAEIARQIVMVLMEALNLAGYPLAVRAAHEGDHANLNRQLKRNFNALLGISLPFVVGIGLCSGDMANIFLGEGYRDLATAVIPLVSLTTFLRGLRVFYFDQAFQLTKKTGATVWNTMIGLLVALSLSLGLIPVLGAVGAGIGTLLGAAVALASSRWIGKASFRMPIPSLDAYKICAGSAAMAVVVVALSRSMVGLEPELSFIVKAISGTVAYFLVLSILYYHPLKRALRRTRL